MCASDHAHSDHKLAVIHAVSLVDELFFCCDDKNVFTNVSFSCHFIRRKTNQSSKLSVSVSILVD